MASVDGGLAEVPDVNRGPVLAILNYVLTGVALLFVLTRCFVRLHVTRGWGWDDTFIILSWVSLVVGCIITQVESNYGRGRHVQYLHINDVLAIAKWTPFYQINLYLTAYLTKVSICFFILRIKDTRRIRWILIFMMVLMTLATIQSVIFTLIFCIPMKMIWTLGVEGRCLPFEWIMISSYVQSAFTIVVDLALTLSPIVIMWNVKIDLKRKILLSVLMSLGLVATIAHALRNIYAESLFTIDFPYNMVPLAICVTLETTLGVIAACIPACWPVLRWLRHEYSEAHTRSKQSLASNSSERNSSILKTVEVTLSEIEREPLRRSRSESYSQARWSLPRAVLEPERYDSGDYVQRYSRQKQMHKTINS